MKKSVIALGLMACSGLVNAAVGDAYAVGKSDGIQKTKMNASMYADFSKCGVFDQYGHDGGETIHCEKGKQFSVMYSGETVTTVATYVKQGDKAFASQTRIGSHPIIGAGMIFEIKYKG